MPTIDLSITITAIIGIAAIVSPILTALLNNHHLKVMKRMELDYAARQREADHENEIFDGYIRAAGACIQKHAVESLLTFGEYSGLAKYYVPKEIRNNMELLEKNIMTDDKAVNIDHFSKIIDQLSELRQPAKTKRR